MENLEGLKVQIEQFKQSRKSKRESYPREIKEQVKKLVASGHAPSRLKDVLQISQDSIQSWSEKRKYVRRKFTEAKIKSQLKSNHSTIEATVTSADWSVELKLSESQHQFLRNLLYAL